LFFFSVLGIKSRTWGLLDKHPTTGLYPTAQIGGFQSDLGVKRTPPAPQDTKKFQTLLSGKGYIFGYINTTNCSSLGLYRVLSHRKDVFC
jgi:hypothetical protein